MRMGLTKFKRQAIILVCNVSRSPCVTETHRSGAAVMIDAGSDAASTQAHYLTFSHSGVLEGLGPLADFVAMN